MCFSPFLGDFTFFSDKTFLSACIGRCHTSPLSGESGAKGRALHSHHLCNCILPTPIRRLDSEKFELDAGAHDFHFTATAGTA